MVVIDAFKEMIKRWNDFTGRSTIGEFWWAQLALLICYIIVGIFEGGLGVLLLSGTASEFSAAIFGIITLAVSIVSIFIAVADLALSIRRIRDAGFPWWFWFANVIPSVGTLAVLVFLCFPTSEPRFDFSTNPQTTSKPSSSTGATIDVVPTQVNETWTCDKCGAESTGKFCPSCGAEKD